MRTRPLDRRAGSDLLALEGKRRPGAAPGAARLDGSTVVEHAVRTANGRVAQKKRFGGELLSNVPEAGSGLSSSGFFRGEGDAGHKGIVVLKFGVREL